MNSGRPLVIGKTGQLAYSLATHTKLSADYWGREKLDWFNPNDGLAQILEMRPNALINTTAYTAVDDAEANRSAAFSVNAQGPGMLAKIAEQLDVPLIHFSTDYVFDGDAAQPYSADDKANPQSVYGASKYEGEQRILASGCQHIIIRVSWVFSEIGTNFVRTMLSLSHLPELSVVIDQSGRPTYAGDLARVVVALLDVTPTLNSGIYHLSGGDQTTWYDFAQEIFNEASRAKLIDKQPNVTPTSTAEYQSKQRANGKEFLARRPLNGVLAESTAITELKQQVNWRAALPSVVAALMQKGKP